MAKASAPTPLAGVGAMFITSSPSGKTPAPTPLAGVERWLTTGMVAVIARFWLRTKLYPDKRGESVAGHRCILLP